MLQTHPQRLLLESLTRKRTPRRTRFCSLRPLLAAAWLLTGSPAAAEEALLSARTQVVVLVGVPGDAETESTYTRQIARLLEQIAQASPRPAAVTVLADDPGLVRAPDALGARVALSSREQLRALAATLAADDLVVFAWGHGGTKGDAPVLHVRGPRIEPADLAALGEKAARSTWFLLFRQSAAFAKHLRAPSRTIVTSESDTAFADDPIGVELLLDLLRDHPGAGAETLARALGPATAAWYDRGHLARAEEPTLWQGTSEPIRLADAAAGSSPPLPSRSSGCRTNPEFPIAWRRELSRVFPEETVRSIGYDHPIYRAFYKLERIRSLDGNRDIQLDGLFHGTELVAVMCEDGLCCSFAMDNECNRGKGLVPDDGRKLALNIAVYSLTH